MAKAVQGQASFIKGQVNTASIARLDTGYFSSCKMMKDFIVQKDGSVRVRGGFDFSGKLESKVERIDDMTFLESDSGRVFIFRGKYVNDDSEKVFYKVEGDQGFSGEIGFDVGNLKSINILNSEGSISLDILNDSKLNDAFSEFSLNKVVRIKRLAKERVVVFFEGCFPFHIWIEGDRIYSAPFYYFARNEIYNAFPFSRTLGNELNVGKVFRDSDGVPLEDPNKLVLLLRNVQWDKRNRLNLDVGTCEAFLGYSQGSSIVEPSENNIIDSDIQSLEKFKGYPICFSVGNRKKDLSDDTESGWDSEMRQADATLKGLSVEESSYPPFLEYVAPVLQSSVNSFPSQGVSFSSPASSTFTDGVSYYALTSRYSVYDAHSYSCYSRISSRNYFYKWPIAGGAFFDPCSIRNWVRGGIVTNRLISALERYKNASIDSSRNELFVMDSGLRFSSFSTVDLYENFNRSNKYFSQSFGSDFRGQSNYAGMRLLHYDYPLLYIGIGNSILLFRLSSSREIPAYSTRWDFDYPVDRIEVDSNVLVAVSIRGGRKYSIRNTGNTSWKVYKAPVQPPPPPSEEEVEAQRALYSSNKAIYFQRRTREVLTALGYRFFCIVPYEYISGTKRMRCRLFSLGFPVQDLTYSYAVQGGDVNRPKKFGLGGNDLVLSTESEGADYTDNFVVTDWFGGFPINGDSIGAKDFLITSDSKLSYSSARNRGVYGSPIKVLFNSSGFLYRISGAIASIILEDDFIGVSEPLGRFFDRIDSGEDSLLFNLGDPFTYTFRDADGNKANIYDMVKSDIGAFTSAGAQSFALSDKGVFFWGVNPDAQNTASFVSLGKVSNFKGSPKFSAMVEVLNRVYVTDEFGDLYVVIYNEDNRNFMAKPCSKEAPLKDMSSGVPFPGNRLLGVRDLGDSKKLYLCTSMQDGELSGSSEFTFGTGEQYKVERVEKFEEDFYVVVKLEDDKIFRILKYNEKRTDDDFGDGKVEPFKGELETAPITVGRRHPFHSFLDAVFSPMKLGVFIDSVSNFKYGMGKGDTSFSIKQYSPDLKVLPAPTNFVLLRMASPEIRRASGVYLSMSGTERGCICGFTLYGNLQEESR